MPRTELSPDQLTELRRQQQDGDPAGTLAALEAALPDRDIQTWPPGPLALGAVCLALCNRADESAALLDQSPSPCPAADPAVATDHALALFLNGRMDDAQDLLSTLAQAPQADALVHSRLGTVLLARGDRDGACRQFEEAVVRDPGRAEFHSNLGTIYLEQDRFEKGLEHFERALRLRSELMPALVGRASCLLGLERVEETLQTLQQDADTDPQSVVKLLALARMQALADKLRDAETSYRKLMDLDPDNLRHSLELAELMDRQDRRRAILNLLPDPHEVEDDQLAATIACRRALVFLELRFLEQATGLIDYAEDRAGRTVTVLLARSELQVAHGAFDKALGPLQEAMELAPGSPQVLSRMGNALMWNGRLDEAADHFERAAQINPMVLSAMVNAHRFPTDDDTVATMRRLAKSPLIISDSRAAMNFALARMLDTRERYDEAFDYLDTANELARRTITFSPAPFTELVDRIIHVFTPTLLARLMSTGVRHKRPIFVVGLPRSGTTLTEQILSSHPDVFGAGELMHMPAIHLRLPHVLHTKGHFPGCMNALTPHAQDHAAAYYLERLLQLDDTRPRVVDKLPHNFIRIGLIKCIFPDAKIIHIRRDVRDVALSSYFQNFKAKGTGLGYAFHLEHMAQHFGDYLRLMDHWRRVLPGEFHELDYERLVAEPEETLKPLMEYLELEWDDTLLDHSRTRRPVMTASVWQARQPVYTSSRERWRRYERQLQPFVDALPPFGPHLDGPVV